ncbi:MAG: hypothetical protein QNJ84_01435 [Alphaproteobacteria bacterium]|nr:hypothetical protein [Alphaproteobacteria bacterium]
MSDHAIKSPGPAALVKSEEDAVKDSLHLLGLNILPLKTPGLKRARLVKNSRLETMVELFNDAGGAGSGQVATGELAGFFPNEDEDLKSDLALIQRFDLVPSFDVYSIRIELRAMQIPIDDAADLQLSEAKRAELTDRMKSFTHPLILHVYGADQGIQDVGDILALFKDPDPATALSKLKKMAEQLDVSLAEIPKFLEDYGDIFLSLAYFRDILDNTVPTIYEFLEWMKELRGNYQVKHDRALDNILKTIDSDLTDVTGSITGRFESFDRKTKDFWDDISAERFHEVRDLIASHHTTIGGVLCGLTLKMDHWRSRFKNASVGGPQQRVEFIRSEVLPGLDWIKSLEMKAAKG